MNNENLNANETEDAVQPQDGEEVTEEVAAPQEVDVESMSDEQFESYINSAQNGAVSHTNTDAADSSDREQSAAAENEDNPDIEGEAEPADEAKPFMVFDTQEAYQGEIDRIVSKRYGDLVKKNREELDTLSRLKAQARNFYQDAADDDAAVLALLEDLQEQCAQRQGISLEAYKRHSQDTIDAERYRAEIAKRESEQAQIAQIHNRWRLESESLKSIVPAFDFEKALDNKTFYDCIAAGKSVAEAYMAASVQEKNAEGKAEKPETKRKPIKQVGNQRGGMAGNVQFDPAKLSDDEFDRYIEKRMNR